MCGFRLGIGACISFYKKILIDIEGIEVCSFVRRKKIKWSELGDYGLSYSGKAKADSYMYNTYYLYFAEEPQKQKNKYKKKLQSDVIKFTVIGEDYYTVIREIIPFCKKMTSVEPLIPVDDFHWI